MLCGSHGSTGTITDPSVSPPYSLQGLCRAWVGSGREGGSPGKSSGRGNGSRVHVRERLKRILLWLLPPASPAAHLLGDSPAASSSRLLGTILLVCLLLCWISLSFCWSLKLQGSQGNPRTIFLCQADSGAGGGCRATGISSVWELHPLRMVRASPEVSPEGQEPPGDPSGDGLPTSAFFLNPRGSSSLWEWVSAQNFID